MDGMAAVRSDSFHSVVCAGCGRRLPTQAHQPGCALAAVLTPAYLERVRELARKPSLAIPGPRRGTGEGGQR